MALRNRPSTKPAEKTAPPDVPATFREELSQAISEALESGIPLEEVQSALHCETDIIDKQFAEAVAAAKKAKK